MEKNNKIVWTHLIKADTRSIHLDYKYNNSIKLDVHIYFEKLFDDDSSIRDCSYVYLHVPKLQYYNQDEFSCHSYEGSARCRNLIDILSLKFKGLILDKINDAKSTDDKLLSDIIN